MHNAGQQHMSLQTVNGLQPLQITITFTTLRGGRKLKVNFTLLSSSTPHSSPVKTPATGLWTKSST